MEFLSGTRNRAVGFLRLNQVFFFQNDLPDPGDKKMTSMSNLYPYLVPEGERAGYLLAKERLRDITENETREISSACMSDIRVNNKWNLEQYLRDLHKKDIRDRSHLISFSTHLFLINLQFSCFC